MKKTFLLVFCALFLNSILFANVGPSVVNYSKFSKQKDNEVVAAYKENTPWGMNVSIDLHSADPKMIRDGKVITKFMKDLVKYINMKAYGEPIVVNFGDTPRVAGYSALQLIETSSITAHFANSTNSVHIDIFSCKYFKPHETALWCKDYFKAEEMNVSQVVFRY
ncbi:MAG: S-adenosylmethionine decarboxylase [Parachlamydiales bacterium]|nr:S-adenosylmethionine decarboxylase [Parachlamydiales bacterium]